jgi:hypothetical protein
MYGQNEMASVPKADTKITGARTTMPKMNTTRLVLMSHHSGDEYGLHGEVGR